MSFKSYVYKQIKELGLHHSNLEECSKASFHIGFLSYNTNALLEKEWIAKTKG